MRKTFSFAHDAFYQIVNESFHLVLRVEHRVHEQKGWRLHAQIGGEMQFAAMKIAPVLRLYRRIRVQFSGVSSRAYCLLIDFIARFKMRDTPS